MKKLMLIALLGAKAGSAWCAAAGSVLENTNALNSKWLRELYRKKLNAQSVIKEAENQFLSPAERHRQLGARSNLINNIRIILSTTAPGSEITGLRELVQESFFYVQLLKNEQPIAWLSNAVESFDDDGRFDTEVFRTKTLVGLHKSRFPMEIFHNIIDERRKNFSFCFKL